MIKSIIGFINGDISITSENSKSVFLSDHTHWDKKKFHQNRTLIKAFMLREVSVDPEIQALNQSIAEMKQGKIAQLEQTNEGLKGILGVTAKPVSSPSIIGDFPINALRYVIMQHYETEQYIWSFARVSTSHSTIEEEFQKVHGREWRGVGGGFYCYITANAGETKLHLFGKSDTFGLRKVVFDEALPALKVIMGSTQFETAATEDMFEKARLQEIEDKRQYEEWFATSWTCKWNTRHGKDEKCECDDNMPY